MKVDHSKKTRDRADAPVCEALEPTPVWLWDMILLWSLWVVLWSLVTL
jgi:hypothetical protein